MRQNKSIISLLTGLTHFFVVILSVAKNLGQILRYAQNDKMYFYFVALLKCETKLKEYY